MKYWKYSILIYFQRTELTSFPKCDLPKQKKKKTKNGLNEKRKVIAYEKHIL